MKLKSSTYLISLIVPIALSVLFYFGKVGEKELLLSVGAICNSFILYRAMAKRGRDMDYAGEKTREFQMCLLQALIGGYLLFKGSDSPFYPVTLIGIAIGIYNIGRGIIEGRVIKSHNQFVKI